MHVLLSRMRAGGGTSFTWLGPLPRVTLMEPELVKEVLAKKFDQIGRPDMGPYGRFLTTGVFSYHGEKWARHRKILNPAFHLEKLKVSLRHQSSSFKSAWLCWHFASKFRSLFYCLTGNAACHVGLLY